MESFQASKTLKYYDTMMYYIMCNSIQELHDQSRVGGGLPKDHFGLIFLGFNILQLR